jgi:hypothetical protein
MNIKLIKNIIALLLLTSMLYAQETEITSFSHQGKIMWSNSASYGFSTVEWASSLTSQWHSSWEDLYSIPVTNETMSADVPMFYRVQWHSNRVSIISEDQIIGVSDGATVTFSGTLSNTVIVKGSILVSDSEVQTLSDPNGDGTLSGGSGGTIDYQTGEISATFSFPSAASNNIVVSYDYYNVPVNLKFESLGTASGTNAVTTGILVKTPVVQRSIYLTADDQSFRDDGTGILVGDGLGTINYETGEIWIGFTKAPIAGVNILIEYYY